MRIKKVLLLAGVSLVLLMGTFSVTLSQQSPIIPQSLAFPFGNSTEWKTASLGGYDNGNWHGNKAPYALYALDFLREFGSSEGENLYAPTDSFYLRQEVTTPDCIDMAIGEYDSNNWIWLQICHIDLESYIPQQQLQVWVVEKGQVLGTISSDICSGEDRCDVPHVHMAAFIGPKFNPASGGGRVPLPFSITTVDLRLDGIDFDAVPPISNKWANRENLLSSNPIYGQCSQPPVVSNPTSPLAFVSSLGISPNVCGYTVQNIGSGVMDGNGNLIGYPIWLNEFSKHHTSLLDVEVHTRVDNTICETHRVTVDGTSIGEASAGEQFITWPTYGWADGDHEMKVQCRRPEDNGNWATALEYTENFYLSPNRAGTVPCNGSDGAELSSGSDCIILTQDFLGLDSIGWNDRTNLTVTVRGNYDAWLYNGFNFEGGAEVVSSGETRSIGNNISSLDVRDPAPPTSALPTYEFPVDSSTAYLFHMNEGSGTQVVDSVTGLVGNLANDNWQTGRFNQGVYLPTGNTSSLMGSINICPMSFEVWVKLDTPHGHVASQNNKFLLTFDALRPAVEFWHPTGSQSITSSTEVVQGTWNLIMFTYDCNLSTKLYLNNVLVGERTMDFPINTGASNFYLGGSVGCSCAIDDIRISNTVRLPQYPEVPTATPTFTPTLTATSTPTPTQMIIGTGTGLLGEYFDNQDFTNLVLTRIDSVIDFDWGGNSADPLMSPDQFSIRWTGQVQPIYTEDYTFCTRADDGTSVEINGILVLDNMIDQGETLVCSPTPISLVAGEQYDITVGFYDNGWDARVELLWQSASQAMGIVPQTQLYPESMAPTETPSLPATPVATNTSGAPVDCGIVANCSFEIIVGSFAHGWNANGFSTVSIDANSMGNDGENSLHLAPSSVYVNVSSAGYAIDSNNSYALSFYNRATSGNGANSFLVDEYDLSWGYIGNLDMGSTYGDYEGIVSYTYVPTSSNVAYISLQLTMNANTEYDVFFDSITVNVAGSNPTPTLNPTTTATDQPDCSGIVSNNIILFNDLYCKGNSESFTNASVYNVTDNDSAISIFVPSGRSVMVYKDTNGAGESRCLGWAYWDLNQDTWEDGSDMAYTISSVQIFDNGSCTLDATATPISTNTPIATLTPTPTQVTASEVELLDSPWYLTASSGSAELYQSMNGNELFGRDSLRVRLNLHGACLLNGSDDNSIIIDQGGWNIAKITNYAQNCLDGEQTIVIPLSDFVNISGGADLDRTQSIGTLHTRIWLSTAFTIDIISIIAFDDPNI